MKRAALLYACSLAVYFASALWLAPACFPLSHVGGAPSVGGAFATGGSIATGGTPIAGAPGATGGAPATGGAAPVVVVAPPCDPPTKVPRKADSPATRRLGPPTQPRLLRMTANEAAPITGPSVWWTPNDCEAPNLGVCEPTDQGPIGACTGYDADNVHGTAPYFGRASNVGGLAAYRGATRIDNGCRWDAATCPGSYPPTDNGSWASSAFQAAVGMGWFTGTRPVVQTPQGWHDALLLGPCGFDQDWFSTGWSTTSCGELDISGTVAGGHSTMANGFVNQEMWLRNSWGKGFGVRGGFFRYTLAQLWDLWRRGAVMVCPAVPPGGA